MIDKYNEFREWVKKSKYGFVDTQEMELESDKKIFEKFETECDKVFLKDFNLKEENGELSVWKSACAKSDNENVMLKKELSNAIEQGYELSNSYKEYLASTPVRVDWVSGFLKVYKMVLKGCNEEELEEIFDGVRFDWKQFNNGGGVE